MKQHDKPTDTTATSNVVFQAINHEHQPLSGDGHQNLEESILPAANPNRSGLKSLEARLVFDSRAHFMAPGLRDYPAPTSRDSSYHLLYILDEGRMELDLQLNHSSRTHPFNLLGQLVGAKGQDRRAFLIPRAGGATLEAKIDDTFTFKFQNLAQGEYRLNVICDRELIEIVLLSL